jgi:hypothetical protein
MEAIAARNEDCTACLTGSVRAWNGGAVFDRNDQDEERGYWDLVSHVRGVCLGRWEKRFCICVFVKSDMGFFYGFSSLFGHNEMTLSPSQT